MKNLDRMKMMDWLYRLCRWTLGGIYIYAGGIKLMEPEIFAVLIDAYGIVPEGSLMPVTIGLPFLEVIAGIGLLFDIRGSLALITGLLVIALPIVAGLFGRYIGRTGAHTVTIAGQDVEYTATAGRLLLTEEEGKKKASFFFVSYTRNDVESLDERPIVFAFNGGPGSSSVWLHLGALGPRRELTITLPDGNSLHTDRPKRSAA